jgi:hypothetical protein
MRMGVCQPDMGRGGVVSAEAAISPLNLLIYALRTLASRSSSTVRE